MAPPATTGPLGMATMVVVAVHVVALNFVSPRYTPLSSTPSESKSLK